jgi:hypothetical protein
MSEGTVIVRKGEAFVQRWNPETRSDEENKKAEQVLSDVLQMPVEIEDTTFAQFFSFITREADLYERIFRAAMYGHPIRPYIEEAAKPAENPESMEYVEIRWDTDRFEGKLALSPAFSGFGSWGEHRPEGMPEKGGIAIEFTALNEYKNLPLKLDTSVEIHDLDDFKAAPFKATLDFTVYDVINAILFEITWSGDISKGRKGCPALANS